MPEMKLKVRVAVVGYAVVVAISVGALVLSNMITRGGWFVYLVGFAFGILFALSTYEMYRGFVLGDPAALLGEQDTSEPQEDSER